MPDPLAYILTWTTHGSWMPGDQRGWVKNTESGIKKGNTAVLNHAQQIMHGSSITLNSHQREIVSTTIQQHCKIRNWHIFALNVRSNHVHLVIHSTITPEETMSQLKAWTSRRLSENQNSTPESNNNLSKIKIKWWTEHGSTKWINDQTYLEYAIRYVNESQ